MKVNWAHYCDACSPMSREIGPRHRSASKWIWKRSVASMRKRLRGLSAVSVQSPTKKHARGEDIDLMRFLGFQFDRPFDGMYCKAPDWLSSAKIVCRALNHIHSPILLESLDGIHGIEFFGSSE